MISCRFIGRLGNNMFQLAACIGLAKKYNHQWAAPNRNLEAPQFYTFWKVPTTPYGFNRYECHDPSQFNFKPIPFNGKSVQLVGFFQSLKYFENAQDEVKEVFKLNHQTGFEDYVSLHVRRGDYVKYSPSFPPLTMSYINNAREHFPGRKLLVFSDDIPWCEANIKNADFMRGNELEDLSLMASCGDHIIANSTFSWWGAYLGMNPDRKIITPHYQEWFGRYNGVKDPIDLIPDNWIQVRK